MKIEEIYEDDKCYFRALQNGKEAGRMKYTLSGSDKIIIGHTETSPDFAGKGVGKILVMEVVKVAREKNLRIIPKCPFAKSVFEKTPEICDVLE